jgi:hypothetical protein
MTVRKAIVAALLSIGALAGYGLHAYAEGAPTTQPVWYAGTVSNDAGPLTGNHQAWVRLYSQPSGSMAALCSTGPTTVPFEKGRFRVALSDACVDIMHKNPDVFVEVSIDDDTKPFPRSKVGAVPYALEAQHAVAASDATGKLKQTIEQLPKITEWTAFTPELYSDSVAINITGKKGFYRRVGDSLEIKYQFPLSPNVSFPDGLLNVRLPNGLAPDEAKMTGQVGHGLVFTNSDTPAGRGFFVVNVYYDLTNKWLSAHLQDGFRSGMFWAAVVRQQVGTIEFTATLPIQGWTLSTP